jgi:hypothetical protein
MVKENGRYVVKENGRHVVTEALNFPVILCPRTFIVHTSFSEKGNCPMGDTGEHRYIRY